MSKVDVTSAINAARSAVSYCEQWHERPGYPIDHSNFCLVSRALLEVTGGDPAKRVIEHIMRTEAEVRHLRGDADRRATGNNLPDAAPEDGVA